MEEATTDEILDELLNRLDSHHAHEVVRGPLRGSTFSGFGEAAAVIRSLQAENTQMQGILRECDMACGNPGDEGSMETWADMPRQIDQMARIAGGGSK